MYQSNSSWISVIKEDIEKGTIEYTVEPNRADSIRRGTISICNETFTVEQTGPSILIFSLEADQKKGVPPLSTTFVCMARNPGGGTLKYQIDYGDGTREENYTGKFIHTYKVSGQYQAFCIVLNEQGHSAKSETISIHLSEAVGHLVGRWEFNGTLKPGESPCKITLNINEDGSFFGNCVYETTIAETIKKNQLEEKYQKMLGILKNSGMLEKPVQVNIFGKWKFMKDAVHLIHEQGKDSNQTHLPKKNTEKVLRVDESRLDLLSNKTFKVYRYKRVRDE